MKYIYPKFSEKEFLGIRLGGAGLGNLLFTYARALILAKETNSKFLFPTWRSLKIGPWIRNEKDKRFYGDLFENNGNAVSGFKKQAVLLTKKHIRVKTKEDVLNAHDNSVLIFDDFTMNFEGLLPYRELIREDIISNLKVKNKKALNVDFSNAINVHIRLGDFSKSTEASLLDGKNNQRLPIDWYADLIKEIGNELSDKVCFNIFSDGTDEELKPVLECKNTKRMFYGTSIADIVALSRAKLIISSGSSFSLWARFLGNSNSISYLNQRKDFVADNGKFEVELIKLKDNPEIIDKIKNLYNQVAE